MYQCFHCGQNTVGWESDFSFEDMGIVMEHTDNGIVHICSCSNCGAEIEYRVPIYEDKEEDKESKEASVEDNMTIYDYLTDD